VDGMRQGAVVRFNLRFGLRKICYRSHPILTPFSKACSRENHEFKVYMAWDTVLLAQGAPANQRRLECGDAFATVAPEARVGC
jgi:hypothetical protein